VKYGKITVATKLDKYIYFKKKIRSEHKGSKTNQTFISQYNKFVRENQW